MSDFIPAVATCRKTLLLRVLFRVNLLPGRRRLIVLLILNLPPLPPLDVRASLPLWLRLIRRSEALDVDANGFGVILSVEGEEFLAGGDGFADTVVDVATVLDRVDVLVIWK